MIIVIGRSGFSSTASLLDGIQLFYVRNMLQDGRDGKGQGSLVFDWGSLFYVILFIFTVSNINDISKISPKWQPSTEEVQAFLDSKLSRGLVK